MTERNFVEELKAAQASVKTLGAKRESLIGDVRVAKSNYERSVEELVTLGVKNAGELTVEGLQKLKTASEAELAKNLDTLNAKIVEAKGVVAEYETAVK